MAVDVRISGWVFPTVRVLEAAATRQSILIKRGALSWRRSTIATTIIVIVGASRWASITISTRAVATRRATTIIVISRVRSTARRARTCSVARYIGLGVCNACNSNTLEFAAIKFFHCGFEVRSGFELNKASFTVPVTTGFRIDDVEAGLTGEVFEVLYPESK